MGDFNPNSKLIGTQFVAQIDPTTQQPASPVNFTYRVLLPSGGYQDRDLQIPLDPEQAGILYAFFQQCHAAAMQIEELYPQPQEAAQVSSAVTSSGPARVTRPSRPYGS